jgi:hypothetical protein
MEAAACFSKKRILFHTFTVLPWWFCPSTRFTTCYLYHSFNIAQKCLKDERALPATKPRKAKYNRSVISSEHPRFPLISIALPFEAVRPARHGFVNKSVSQLITQLHFSSRNYSPGSQ